MYGGSFIGIDLVGILRSIYELGELEKRGVEKKGKSKNNSKKKRKNFFFEVD